MKPIIAIWEQVDREPTIGQGVWVLLTLPEQVACGTVRSVSNIDGKGLGNTYCDVETALGMKHLNIAQLFAKRPRRVSIVDEFGPVTVWR